MKRCNKKGFTIVELVIVIAVIAILAAVLIPTIAGLVKKANLSADQQAVRQMNVALATAEELDDINDVIDALAASGYNSKKALIPVSADHGFFWYESAKSIVLVKGETVVFPANIEYDANGISLENNAKYLDVTANTPDALFDAIAAGYKDIKLEADVTVDAVATIPADADVVIDLNGKKLDATATGRPFALSEGSSLTINAGDATVLCGSYGLVNIPEGMDATVTLNGGNYVASTDKGAFIKVRQGEANINIELNNVNYVDSSSNGYVMNADGFNGELSINVNGGSYTADRGFQALCVKEAKFNGVAFNTKGVAINSSGDVEVKNCTFNIGNGGDSANEGQEPVAAVAISNNATATITGCTITTEGTPAYRVYPSGGNIVASNNTVSGVDVAYFVHPLYENQTAKVTIDGTVVYDSTASEE